MKQEMFLTIDVDFTDYFSGKEIDELDFAFDKLKKIFIRHPSITSTWFIRIDNHIKDIFGSEDYIFKKHTDKISWLYDNGHEIAWHHHTYKKADNNWVQDTDVAENLRSIEANGQLARGYEINTCRMGWGYQTNETMKLLNDLGFKIDSSAIPRPKYKWEKTVKDWTNTPLQPYHPSVIDYRIPGADSLKILEVPMSTTSISSQTDTESNVIRYINPIYKSEVFAKAVNSLMNSDIVMIMHPYEIIKNQFITNSLLSFDTEILEENLVYALNIGYQFKRMDSISL